MKQNHREASHDSGDVEAPAKETILYVEDNSINCKVARFFLEQHYRMLIASDSREACRLIRSEHGRLAAILMDIELQGSDMDGILLTRLIRGRLDPDRIPEYARGIPALGVPVIFVTALSQRYGDDLLADAGGNRCIAKPVNFGRLLEALAELAAPAADLSYSRL